MVWHDGPQVGLQLFEDFGTVDDVEDGHIEGVSCRDGSSSNK